MPSPDPNQDAIDMLQRYRNVFGTAEGKLVLGDILFNLGHFGDNIEPTDPVLSAERNIAVTIARMAGAFNTLYNELGMTQGD